MSTAPWPYSVFAATLAAAGLPIYIHAPKFYVDEFGVGLAALGGVLFGLRLLDVIQDPFLGWLSRRTAQARAAAVAVAAAAATAAAAAWFGSHVRNRGFGNGRLARNLFEAAVARHATRLVEIEDPTDEQLTTLEAVDIASVPLSHDDEVVTPADGDDPADGEPLDPADPADNTGS